MPPFTMIA